MRKDFEYCLELYDFEKRESGYVRDNPNGISQAVTLFQNNKIQMFGWFSENPDIDEGNLYSTGIIEIKQLKHFYDLMEIFDQYKEQSTA